MSAASSAAAAAAATGTPAPSATGSPSGLEAIHQALRPARHRAGQPLRPPGPQTLLAPHDQPQRSSTTVGVGGAGTTGALVAQQAVQIAALEAKFEQLAQKTKRQENFAAAYAGKKRGRYEGFPLRVTRCV